MRRVDRVNIPRMPGQTPLALALTHQDHEDASAGEPQRYGTQCRAQTPVGHDQAAQHGRDCTAERLPAEHPRADPGAVIPFQDVDRQAVHRHVVSRGAGVDGKAERRQQINIARIWRYDCTRRQYDNDQHLGADDPDSAAPHGQERIAINEETKQ